MKQKFFELYCRFLAQCARRILKHTKPLVIGIHGSVGKTSCRMIVTQTLQTFFPSKTIYTSPENYNGEMGLSLSIAMVENFGTGIGAYLLQGIGILRKSFFMKKSYDIIVLEYGIDHPGEMDFLLSICKPDIGISTALDKVHSEQFGDPQALAQEEIKMILATKELVFLNTQEPYTAQLQEMIDVDIMTYSTTSHDQTSDINFHHEQLLKKKGRIGTKMHCFIKQHKVEIETNMIGKENYGYISLALALVEVLSYRFHKPVKLHQQQFTINYALQPGRLSIFQGINDSVIIDSTYNNSPLSLRKTIDTTLWIKRELFPQHELVLVVGDMRELGDFEEQEHRLIAGYLNQATDRIVLVGKVMGSHTYDELVKIGHHKDQISSFTSSKKAGLWLKEFIKHHDKPVMVLCKGSQNTIFLEETVKLLLAKNHDHKLLTRQSKSWLSKKEKRFTSLGE